MELYICSLQQLLDINHSGTSLVNISRLIAYQCRAVYTALPQNQNAIYHLWSTMSNTCGLCQHFPSLCSKNNSKSLSEP